MLSGTRRNAAGPCTQSSAYAGNSDLADALVEHEEEIRQLIGGINGFKAYYLLKLAEGTSTISIFEDQEDGGVKPHCRRLVG